MLTNLKPFLFAAFLCVWLTACGGSDQYDYNVETKENAATIYQNVNSFSKEVGDGMASSALGLPSRQVHVIISEINGVNVKPPMGFFKTDYKTLKLPQGSVQLGLEVTTIDTDVGALTKIFPMQINVNSTGAYQIKASAEDPLHHIIWIEDESGNIKGSMNVMKTRKKGFF